MIELAIAITALALSLMSLLIVLKLYTKFASSRVRHERVHDIVGFRRYRRVKRYVLLKIVCLSDVSIEQFSKALISHIYKTLGPSLRIKCGLTLIAARPDLNRAIIRVSGESECVKQVLLALSIRHLVDDIPCLTIPLRTSGLVSRLKKYLKVYS